jgi:hypothetical protein
LLISFFTSAQNQEIKNTENTYPQKYTQSGFSILHNFLDYEESNSIGLSHIRMKKWSKNYAMGLGLHLFPMDRKLKELAFFMNFVNRLDGDLSKNVNFYIEMDPTIALNPYFYSKSGMNYYPGFWFGTGLKIKLNQRFSLGAQANGISLYDIDNAEFLNQSIFQLSIFFK